MKRVYIPIGCTQQERLRPGFVEAPQRHTRAQRASETEVDRACAIHQVRKSANAADAFIAFGFVAFVAACALLF